MNIRKSIDYSTMFKALDSLMAMPLPQMELYCKIGRLVSNRPEKGAAVAAAEYLCCAYPEVAGFSPRNLRRMRNFYRAYESSPETLDKAMAIGWTQNIVILEAELTPQERAWYIQAVNQHGWSKLELQRKIESKIHLENSLGLTDEVCYAEETNTNKEQPECGKNSLCVLWEYLPQYNDQVYYEGSGEKGWTGIAVCYRVRRLQHRKDWVPCLSAGPPQSGRAWDQLRGENSATAHTRGQRPVRSPGRYRPGQPAEYATHLRRRLHDQGWTLGSWTINFLRNPVGF